MMEQNMQTLQWAFLLLFGSAIISWLAYPFMQFIIHRLEKVLHFSLKEDSIKLSRWPYGLLLFCLIWYTGLPFLDLQSSIIRFIQKPLFIIFGYSLVSIGFQVIDIFILYIETITEKDQNNKVYSNLIAYSKKVLKVALFIIAVIIVLQNAGFNVTSLVAGLGIGGVAIALGAKETLGNFFGGFSIIVDKPFTVGDWICCDTFEGTVEDIGFRSTQIKTFYDSVVTLPNSVIANSIVDNLGLRKARRTRFNLDITYDSSPEKIEAFLEGIKNILKTNNYVRKDYFQVYFSGYATSSLQIFINFFLKVSDWDSELLQKQNIYLEILKLSKKVGVAFAFPTQTLDVPKAIPHFQADVTKTKKDTI